MKHVVYYIEELCRGMIAELYYHDYSSDTDTFICEVSDEDICNLCD